MVIVLVVFTTLIYPERAFSYCGDGIITSQLNAIDLLGALYLIGLFFKTLGMFLDKFVNITVWTNKDNDFLVKLKKSKLYLFLAILTEVFLRIKLPFVKNTKGNLQ